MRPPRPRLAPRGRDHQAAPPAAARERHQGTVRDYGELPPPLPPPLFPSGPRRAGGRPGERRPRTPPPPGPGGTPPGRAATRKGGARSVRRAPPVGRPRQAGSPAPALKGAPWAAAGRRHPDMSQCSVKGGAQTKRPTLVRTRPQTAARRRSRPPPREAPRPSLRGGVAY